MLVRIAVTLGVIIAGVACATLPLCYPLPGQHIMPLAVSLTGLVCVCVGSYYIVLICLTERN